MVPQRNFFLDHKVMQEKVENQSRLKNKSS